MKLGLDCLPKPVVIVEPEAVIACEEIDFLKAELELVQAGMEVNAACEAITSTDRTSSDLNDIIATIKIHGIDDGMIMLLGEEISTVTESFAAKNTEACVIALEEAKTSLGDKAKELFEKLIAALKAFGAKILKYINIGKAMLKKQLARVKDIKKPEWADKEKLFKKFTKEDYTKLLALANDADEFESAVMTQLKSKKWDGGGIIEETMSGDIEAKIKAVTGTTDTAIAIKQSAKEMYEEIKHSAEQKIVSLKFNEMIVETSIDVNGIEVVGTPKFTPVQALQFIIKINGMLSSAFAKDTKEAISVIGNIEEADAEFVKKRAASRAAKEDEPPKDKQLNRD